MSLSVADSSFVGSQALPFDLYEPLLAWVFRRPEFRQWLSTCCKWQLRVVGGPGSGKTTLSALTIEHLRGEFAKANVRILSIFFRCSSALEDSTLTSQLLQEIWRQLCVPTDADASTSEWSLDDLTSNAPASRKLESLRQELATRLSQLDRAFLILDDVDLCSQKQWIAIDAELSNLQQHNMNIMTTSRLSLWEEYSSANCDTGWPPEHGHIDSRLFWYCTCQDSIEEAMIVCQKCKEDGYICGECNRSTAFVEPYDHVDLSLDISDRKIMSAYVSHMLELIHGDLSLSSFVDCKPAPSKLGRALLASATAATQLRDKIVADAEGNITMAKLRLEAIDSATTTEEVMRYGDRLPATIISLFDTGIASIQTQNPEIAELGLKAIVGVANEFHEHAFESLRGWLQRQINQESHGQSLSRDLTLEDVLRAAAGFLVVDNDADHTIRLYHGALEYYVVERYNEALFWTHTSTNTVDAGEFQKPKRMQTWHASRHHLTRADTWK